MKLRLILEGVFSYKKIGNLKWSFIDSTETELVVEVTNYDGYFEFETFFLINNQPKYSGPIPNQLDKGSRGETIFKIFEKEIIPLIKSKKIEEMRIFPLDNKRYEFFNRMIQKFKNEYEIIHNDNYKIIIKGK